MKLDTETGTTTCPLCGVDTPHYHHPQARHVAELIASWFTGAGEYSDFNKRWIVTERGRSAIKLADRIIAALSQTQSQAQDQ